jgi:hypothetical protein
MSKLKVNSDNAYKKKYAKYKTKYIELRDKLLKYENSMVFSSNSEYTDNVIDPDYIKQDQLIRSTNSKYPYYLNVDSGDEDSVEINSGAEPESSDSTDLFIAEETQKDVGIFGVNSARGKIRPKSEFSSTDFTKLDKTNGKNKVLLIDNIDTFDEFTELYGGIYNIMTESTESTNSSVSADKAFLYIKWNKVADKYRGIFIHPGIMNDRFSSALFKGILYDSWWQGEYKVSTRDELLDNSGEQKVFIFEEPLYVRYQGKKVDKPFTGKVFKENHFSEDNYTHWHKGPDNEKILLLDKIKGFDKFTNKYGDLKNNKVIKINWNKVRYDWKGIYIDKDAFDLFYVRYNKSFLNGQKYASWWKNENVYIGVVYIFD